MDILSKIKKAAESAKTEKNVMTLLNAGMTVVDEVSKAVKEGERTSRLEQIEKEYDYELLFEKRNSPYIDGAVIFDSTKSVYLKADASDTKGARFLNITDSSGTRVFTRIYENRSKYKRNGDRQNVDLMISTDGIYGQRIETKTGIGRTTYTLAEKKLQAFATMTGYKVVNSNKETVAETVGRFRNDENVLIYIKDETDFILHLSMLFLPVFAYSVSEPDNFSQEYERYINKVTKRGLFF